MSRLWTMGAQLRELVHDDPHSPMFEGVR